MKALVVLVALTGCRQVLGIDTDVDVQGARIDASDDIDAEEPDDATDDVPFPVDSDIDAPLPPIHCMDRWRGVTAPTFAITPLASLDSAGAEDTPFLLSDERTIYFTRDLDFYRATRTSIDQPFGEAVPVPSLNTTGFEGRTFVNDSETRAFFTSNRPGAGDFDLWRGARGSTTESFAVDQNYVGPLNNSAAQIDPWLRQDLLHLYYADSSNGPFRLVFGSRATVNDNFGSLTYLGLAGGGGHDYGPALTPDETLIVWTTGVMQGSDLFYAVRNTASASFGPPVRLDSINSATTDRMPHLSADGCRLYFSSDRGTSRDLYEAVMVE